MAVAMSRAAAICLGLFTSKVSVVALINSPPFGKCSERTVEGGVIFSASQGQRYLIQASEKYERNSSA